MRSQKQNQKVRILILLLICLAAVIFSDFMTMGSTNAAPTYALFMDGPSFQSSITSIVHIEEVKEVRRDTSCDPRGHHAIDISDSASPASIYARSDDGVVLYYCSDAGTLYLNKDSSTMFSGFSRATVIETQGWDTSEAKEMQYMFYGCERLANLDVSNFDSSHALHVNSMFEGCESLTSLDLRRFRADTVLDMNRMFAGCKYLTTLRQNFDTSRVTNMKAMFEGCGVLPDLDVSHWDTINVTDMSYMFHGCNILTSLDVSNWRTSSVKDMSYMFQSCGNLTELNVSNWDTSSVRNMNSMFSNCRSLSQLDVSHWDTRRVEDMSNMFSNCDRVTGLNVSNWDTSNVTNMSRMFNGCQNLTNLDVRGFVTSSVTDMSHMFHACTSLTGIDVSHFDTHNVRDMSYMFTKCINVNNLDVGNFVTSNVTNMSHMFDSCSSLTGLDFRNFDTHNVTDMSYMFNECARLPNLDMSYFDTSSVRNMSYMFGGCSSLPDLDLSHFDVRNVEIMSYMFYNCSGLKKIGHNFDTRSAKIMSHMFAGCERLANLDVSNFSTYNVTDMRHMFDSCKTLTSLDLRNWDTTNVAHMEGMFKDCNHLSELKQDFNTRAVRTMEQMFQGCTNLEGLDLSRWDTRNVTKMGDMFNGCAKIRDLNLSSFRTDRVQDMQRMFSGCSTLEKLSIKNLVTTGTTNTSYMFKGCSSLEELNLNNWDTSNVIYMTEMFQGCDDLKYIYVSATGFRTNNVINSVDMFADSPNLIGGHGTKWNSGAVSQSRAVPDSETASGYLTYDIAVSFKNSAGTELARQIINVGDTATAPSITGYHVLGYYTNPGLTNGFNLNSTLSNYTQVYLDWECASGYVLKSGQCVEPTTTTFLAGTTVNTILKSLATGATVTSVNASDTLIQQIVRTGAIATGVTTGLLSTANSDTPIIAWFDNGILYYYSDADVIYLNQESPYMFYRIKSCTYIDTSGWNTSNVTSLFGTFDGCSSLTGLDVSNWNTSSVTNMHSVFGGCSSLTKLDVSEWDTSNVTRMSQLFQGCSSLTGLDVSNWDTSRVTNMQSMFSSCSSLTGLDVSNWDTSRVTNMQSMFSSCSSLTGLDVSNWNTSSVITMYQMFMGCSMLESLDASNWNTSSVTNMGSMFSSCSKLKSLGVSNWNTSNVTDMSSMFNSCSSLTGLDVSNWNTSGVRNMNSMFKGCRSLTGLDVSSWNTSNVTTMSNMFANCTGLTNLDVSSWDTSSVTNMEATFSTCSSLTNLDVSNWNTSGVTSMDAMFYRCSSLTGLDVSNWNTSNVTNMGSMFDGCSNLIGLDVSNWDTSNVTATYSMFNGCIRLTNLDLSNWDTSNVTNMRNMFQNCYNLETIYASAGFVTSGVSSSSSMFYSDTKLVGGHGTQYSSAITDKTRAVIDSESASGYFTDDIVVSFKSISNGVELARQIINVGDRAVVPTITGYYVLGYYSNVGMSGTFDFSQNLTKFTEVYVNWNECDTGYLLKNGLCVAPLTATFEQGEIVNKALKSLATGATVSDYQKQDTLIQQIVRTGAVAQGVTTRVISTPTSEVPIVAWYDNHTIYYYTEADTIYLNQDSSIMFFRISSGTYIDTSGWDASRVTDMHQMFMECHSLETLDVSDWDTSSVTTMEGMFSECSSLTGLDVSNWDTSSVTDMHQMFEGCTGLTELDVSNWDTSSVTTMEGMFAYCSSLTGLDVSNWDTSNVRDMSYMFSRCNRLTELDLRNWDTSRVTNMFQMFIRCASLKTIYASTGFVVTGVTNSTNMFRSTSLIGGHGTRQNILGYTNKSGAVLDSETASGYFTYDIAISYRDRYNLELARQIINVGSSTVAPVITGYRVLGYYTDSNMNTPFVFSQSLRKYTQVYVDVAYVVNFEENGADSIGAHTLTGSSIVLPSITRNGWTILGWSTNSGDTLPKYQVGETFNPRADTTLYAITKNTYTATFEQNGADSISTSTATCDVYNRETTCSGSGTITMCDRGNCRVISDRNLGASISGTGGVCSYGNYYQWGNNYGFSSTGTISTSSTRVNASGYGPGNYYLGSTFIVTSSTPYDWSSVPNLNLRGEGPTTTTEVRQGPCPDGYHVPSKKEWDKMSRMWEELVYDGNSSTIGEQFRETFKLPFAGLRDFSSAAVSEQGEAAYYWLSTPYDGINNDQAHRLYFTSDSRDLNNTDYRANGFSIRCFKDESGVGPDGVSYQVRSVNIPEITRDGWTVLGWSTNSGDTTAQYSGCGEILLSGDTTFYAITSKSASATFKPNGNKLDNQSSDVNRNCTMYNTQTGCQITTPTITASGNNTPTIVGYTTSSSGTDTASIGSNANHLIAGGETLYAHTMKAAETYTVNFDANGNTLDTNSVSCSIAATYDGNQQASSCNTTCPTITASVNTPNILGFSSGASNHDTFVCDNHGAISLNSGNNGATYYAQTTTPAITHTVTFYKNGAASQTPYGGSPTAAESLTQQCTRAATFNGVAQSGSCNIKSPTITPISRYGVVGYAETSGATVSTWTHNTDKSISGDSTYYAITKPLTATFLPGNTFNTTLKSLATGATVTSIDITDNLIQQVVRTGAIAQGVTTGELSTSTSETPIIAWYDNGTIYYYTEADTIYLNSDSRNMFYTMRSVRNIDMEDWDTSSVRNMSNMFRLCSSLTGLDVSNWNTSSVTNMESMFNGCSSLTGLDVSDWITSGVTNMKYMFYDCSSLTGLDVSNWNTSRVTNMYAMFYNCSSLTGLDVSDWITSGVTNMKYMFYDCSSLTGLDVSNWNTSRVTTMESMFTNCSNLIGLDVSSWNTSRVTNMSYMFKGCSRLTGLDVSNWETSSVTTMESMFTNCSNLIGLDVSDWTTSGVTNMKYMFYGCSNLTGLDVSNWETSSVENMYGMFNGCSSLTGLDVSSWNTSNVTTMEYMFQGCSNLTGLDVSDWITSGVTNMKYIFNGCSNLTLLDVSHWDTSSVTTMESMFAGCSSLTGLDVSHFVTSGVTNMQSMFQGCSRLTGLDVSHWDTSSVTNMQSMFNSCSNLTELDVSRWDVSSVTDMRNMFYNCSSLTGLDVSNWDTSSVTNMQSMFNSCSNLEAIYASTGFITSGVTNSNNMFSNDSKLIGGYGTRYPSLGTNKSGAVLDSESASGYLTYDIAVNYKTAGGTELARQVINVGSSTVTPTITGYHVLGYYSNSGLSVPFDFNQNLRKYTEVYVDYNFVATFEENGATSIGASTLSGLSVVTPSITRDGWTVLGWSTNSGDTLAQYEVGETIPLTGDITLYAITKKTYTATFEQNGADSIGTSSATCDAYNTETTCRAAGTITICNPNNPGECLTMMDRNLGASVAGTGFCSYGNFYQWGNNYGFPNTGSVTTAGGKVDCTPYGDGNDYSSSTFRLSSDNWCSTQVDSLWGGANDINNNGYGYTGGVVLNLTGRQGPCPDGYHVPSIGEWGSALSRWASGYALSGNSITLQGTAPLTYFENNGNASSAFRDYFMVPLAGYRHRSYATLSSLGTLASLWSSSYYDNYREARSLYVNSSEVKANPKNNRASAYSIRCFKDSADSTVNAKNIVDSISAPSITRDGWDIIGWNTNSGATTAQYFGCDEILLSGDITLYAITSRSASATFKPNGNKLDNQTEDVNKNCTMYNTQTGCQITTPTITASGTNTPTPVGYTTSSIGTGTATIGSNSNISISGGETYYAHTKKAAVTLTAKWNANGATLSSTADRMCQLVEVYNGAAQATSCTVDAPTITASSNTPTILGFNTTAGANSNHANYDISTNKLTLTSALDNQTWYAQTTTPAITHTVTFYKNGASTQTNAGGTAVTDETVTRTCTRAATFNGAQQDSTCSITSPTIVGTSNTPNIIGYSTGANNHVSTWNHNTLKTDISSDLTYYAQTQSDQWTYGMSFSGNGNSIIPTSKTCNTAITYNNASPTQSCNTTCPTITPPSGFTPIGFSTSANAHNAGVCTNGGSITLNPTNSGSTAYAQSSRDRTVTVTFDKNGNGGSTSTQTCNPATEYNGEIHSCTVTCLDITPANGFTTIGWGSAADTHSADACLTGGTSPSVSSDTTYYAQSSKSYNKITINFNVNGNGGTDSTGECTPDTVYNGATGGSCSITSPTITATSGFTTIGWNSNSNTHASEWNENTAKDVTENATYYAQSSRDRVVTVTFNNNGNGGSTTTQTCNPATEYNGEIHSCAVTCPDITPANGFTTIGWGSAAGTHSADVCFTGGTSPSLSGDTTYYAQTRKVTTATYKPNGNLLDGGTADLTRSCTGYNGASTCNVTTPTISNAATTYVIGYSSSSASHTSTVGSNATHAISTAGGGTWYAQTQSSKISATFEIQDRNAAYMRQSILSSKKYTMDKDCRKYNGEANCKITAPTINNENNSRYTIIGWNTNPNAIESSLDPNSPTYISDDTTYYSITRDNNSGRTITFYANGNNNGDSSAIAYKYNGENGWRAMSPNIFPANGFYLIGWSNAQNRHENDWTPGTVKLLSSSDSSIYYAQSYKTISARFDPNRNRLDGGTSQVRKYCTGYNGALSCTVTTPTITNPITTTVVGYTTSSSRTDSANIGSNVSYSIEDGKIYYAHTKKTVTATYKPNGNLLNGVSADVIKSCVGYDGDSTCNITTPTISNTTTTGVIGYSNGSTSHTGTVGSDAVHTIYIAGGGGTRYAQTQGILSHTGYFYKNGADRQTNASGTSVPHDVVTRTCSVTVYNGSTGFSCDITSPTITRNGFNPLGYNTDSYAYTSNWPQNTSKTISGDVTYYAITNKNVRATFVMGTGVSSILIDNLGCTIWNSATSCNINLSSMECNTSAGYTTPKWNGTLDPGTSVSLSSNTTYTGTCSDTTPPTCNWGTPTNTCVSGGVAGTITLTCIDGVGISQTSINANDVVYDTSLLTLSDGSTENGTSTTKMYTFTYIGKPGISGTTRFTLGSDVVKDTSNNGNVTESQSQTLQIDNAGPSAPILNTVTSPTNDTTPTLSWNAVMSDNGCSSVSGYEVRVCTTPACTSATRSTTTTGTTRNVSAALPDTDKTTYYWKVRTKDALGNRGDWSSTGSFILDTTAPDSDGSHGSALPEYVNSGSNITVDLRIAEIVGMNTSEFSQSDVHIYVGGVEIYPNKTLTYNGDNAGVYTYNLTLSNLTGDGALKVVVPAGSFTDNAGNPNSTLEWNNLTTVDNTLPTYTLDSTANSKSSSQRLTGVCSDNEGITQYYIGNSQTPNYTAISSTGSFTTGIDVTSAGTYYLFCKDAAGNVVSGSKTYNSYTVYNMLETITGASGQYNTQNYVSASSAAYIAPKLTIFTLANIYTVPNNASVDTYRGYSTGNNVVTTNMSSITTLNGDNTYYAWFDRQRYTLDLVINTGINLIKYKVNGADSYASTQSTLENIVVKAGSSISAYATAKSGYTHTQTTLSDPWTVASVSSNNVFSPVTVANTDTHYTVYHYVKIAGESGYLLSKTETILSGTTDSVVSLSSLAQEGEFLCAHYSSGSLTGTESGPGEIVTHATIRGDGSTKIYLYYIRNTRTVTLSGDAHIQTLEGDGTVRECGSEVPVNAIPKPGYHFVRWDKEERREEGEGHTE